MWCSFYYEVYLPAPSGYWRRQLQRTSRLPLPGRNEYNTRDKFYDCVEWIFKSICNVSGQRMPLVWCCGVYVRRELLYGLVQPECDDTRLVWLLSPPRLSRRFNRSWITYPKTHAPYATIIPIINILLITKPYELRKLIVLY